MTPNQILATAEQARKFIEHDVEEEDDVQAATDVLITLGVPRIDPDAAKRYVRFLLPTAKRYLWTWEVLGCEPPGPSPAIEAVARWLETGERSRQLSDACLPCVPTRDGEPVMDCDEPALSSLASAASRLAYFCYTLKTMDAAMVLVELFWADMENLQPDDGMVFEEWLVNHAPKNAWE